MKKIVVIGGGVGGYVAAIRAAQLGAEVTLIEKQHIGGTCLNEGCIPTKVLLHTAELYSELLIGEEYGIKISGETIVDWEKLQQRKAKVVSQLVGGVKVLLQYNKVNLISGVAKLNTKNSVTVTKENGETQTIEADNIIIATGSEPFVPPILGVESKGVIDSTGALNLDKIPKSLTIIGGGVIGIEFAYLYSTLGTKVKIVEMMPEILPRVDGEIVSLMRMLLENKDIKIFTNAKVTSINEGKDNLNIEVETEKGKIVLTSEKVLLSVGRKARIEGLNLEGVGIKTEKNLISVNQKMETNIPGIYAIGDVNGKTMLAHVASEQGIIAVENIMGANHNMDYKVVPSCIYTKPEIASVGMTEEEAKEKKIAYKIGKFPLSGNGKSIIANETEGFVKIVSDEKYGEILGVHMIGPRATELIAEAALALKLEATVDEIVATIHAHPTVSESIKESALAVNNVAIHNINK